MYIIFKFLSVSVNFRNCGRRVKILCKMPTVLLLDNSLSMLCPVAPTTTAEGNTAECYLELAKVGLERVLAHLEAKFKLESVSLMTFSSTYNVLAPFTREVSSVRNKLRIAEAADTSEFIQGLRGLSIYVRSGLNYLVTLP